MIYVSFKKHKWKNSFLIFLGILLVIINLNIGDYCTGGLEDYLSFFIYLLLFIMSIKTIQIRKTTNQLNLLPLIIIVLILAVSLLLPAYINSTTSKKIRLTANIFLDTGSANKNGVLTLYADGFYSTKRTFSKSVCEQFGSYQFKRDTLYLIKNEEIERCENLFTNKYILNISDSILTFPEDISKSLRIEFIHPEISTLF